MRFSVAVLGTVKLNYREFFFQLLNELRGPVVYNVSEERGQPPATIFVMEAVVNGNTYAGEGKNKKEAKKACAMNVLKV